MKEENVKNYEEREEREEREVKENERVRHIDGDIRNNYFKNLEIVNR